MSDINQNGATQLSVSKERVKICEELFKSAGETLKLEMRVNGEQENYEFRKVLFSRTEGNYRRYRNLQTGVGKKITQTNESVKSNIGLYIQLNKDLSNVLKNIAKGIKDVKTKVADLKDMACKLESCKMDSCNKAQWIALTGEGDCKKPSPPSPPDCPPPGQIEPPPQAMDPCKKSSLEHYNCLIEVGKRLPGGIDSIFKSSFDVVGIQVFSSIDSMDQLQKDLDEQSKKLEKLIGETTKKREDDLKKLQDELVKSKGELTKAIVDRSHQRSSYEGYKDAAEFLCGPYKCNCTISVCEQDITTICKDVKKAFCDGDCAKPETSPPEC